MYWRGDDVFVAICLALTDLACVVAIGGLM